MCRICSDLDLFKMTPAEARRNLDESTNMRHRPEVEKRIEMREVHDSRRDAYYQMERERMGWEGPAGSGEETGV